MSIVPVETPVTEATLVEWFKLKEELDRVRAKEMLLRQLIFRHYFPDAKEGTNTFVLPDMHQLKGVRVITRKIVEEAMQAMCQRPQVGVDDHNSPVYGPSMLEKQGVHTDQLIKWKPELAISYYRALTEEQQRLVDQMLVIDNGSPSLKIEPPSKRKQKES